MNDYTGLLNMVTLQNKKIVKAINEVEDRHTTTNQINNYKNEQSAWFKSMNKMLMYIYYFMALILSYLILINKKISRNNKIVISITLLVFPFVINPIEMMFYNTLRYIWTFIMCIEYR
jgi:hypothetical protein